MREGGREGGVEVEVGVEKWHRITWHGMAWQRRIGELGWAGLGWLAGWLAGTWGVGRERDFAYRWFE
jgi:hypothetical protein